MHRHGAPRRGREVVPHAALEQHEERADLFVWATGTTLALASVVLIVRSPVATRLLTIATLAGTVAVGGLL